MEIDAPFVRLIEDLPESLSGNRSFVEEIIRSGKVVSVKKGDYLIRTNEICQDGYFINKGLFLNLYVNAHGNECVIGFAADNMYPFLSSVGFFTKQPSDFEIKAIEPGELLCFSRDHLEDMSKRYPEFATYYQNIMLTIIYKRSVLLAVRQSCSAEEFIRYMYSNYAWLTSRVPDKFIAQYIGISSAWYCKLKKKVLPEIF